jgi:hypothetical protein
MVRQLRTLILFIAVLAHPATAHAAAPAQQTADEECFPQTGSCVHRPFLAHWRANGGIQIFGLPLADAGFEVLEDRQLHLVQYFERARFEYHPGNTPPHDILLGQFGRQLHPADPPVAAQPGMTYFTETGHNVAADFLAYWQANGGLAQFGYPLSEVFRETLEDGQEYEVQYFERARFERHPRNGPPHTVQVGEFGRAFFSRSLLSPRDGPPACTPADLLVSVNRGAGLGTTYIMVTLQHQGDSPCTLGGFVHPGLLDAQGASLPVATGYWPAFNATQTQSPFTLHPGQSAQGMLRWANNCPTELQIDPTPAAALTVTLPNRAASWTFPMPGPRCGPTGQIKGIGSHALSIALTGPAEAAQRTLDAYFFDINQGKHRRAFVVLSPELQAQLGPYERFVDGFATTTSVAHAITGYQILDGATARLFVRLVAWQTDDTARYYIGSYDVVRLPDPLAYPDGRIVAADIAEEFP